MNPIYLFSILLLGIFGWYVWWILPQPYYRLEQRNSISLGVVAINGRQKSRLLKLGEILVGLLLSLKLRHPAIEFPERYIPLLLRYLHDPTRPIICRKELGDYYVGIPKYFASLGEPNKTVMVFRSRLDLLAFPFRFVLDHLISPPLIYLSLAAYVLGVVGFAIIVRLPSFRLDRVSSADTDAQNKSKYFRECVDYLNLKQAPWEFGYLIFKALEGFQFRKTVAEFGYKHPICEFGIEDGVISANHLKGIDYIDVGCEAIKGAPMRGEIEYRSIVNCYIEENPFQVSAFNDIYLIHVVDHIPNLSNAFSELFRLTRPGGKVSFSGLSGLLSGYYLESAIYEGNIYNNRNLDWYRSLAEQHGFDVVYAAYCQGGVAFQLWRFTVFFHHRTEAWNIFSSWFARSLAIRRFYGFIVNSLLLRLFLLDEQFVSDKKMGLNFMMVLKRP